METLGCRRRRLRGRVFGVAGAAVAVGVLAACAAAATGGRPGLAVAGTPAPSCPQASALATAPAGSLSVSGNLDGVAALPSGNVWAVGSTVSTDPMTINSSGGGWAVKALTLRPGHPADPPGELQAVAVLSARDVWAVGVTAGEPLAEHFNGRSWTVVPTPPPGPAGSGLGAWLQGVAAASAGDIWAVGQTDDDQTWTIHWDGSAWTRVPSPNPAHGTNESLYGVAVAAPSNVWAVGSYTSKTGSSPLIEHWNGQAWTLVPSPAIPGGGTLSAVSANSPDSAWAVGQQASGSLIEHWDGRAWTRVATPALPGGSLHGVTALGPASAWAVGAGRCPGPPAATTIIEHWNGQAWTLVPSPAAGELDAVTAASPASAWAVGYAQAVGGPVAVVEHWDGKAWTWLAGFCSSPSAPGCPPPTTAPAK